MRISSNIAFKEWAVVVDALGQGEQMLILRKGGIREQRGEFHVDHQQFWLFPTQYHEAERSIIASKRPVLQELAASTKTDSVDIQYLAVANLVIKISDIDLVGRLQGKHIWTEQILRQRFEFGREPGLHALIVRVHRLAQPVTVPLKSSYGGCKSWIEFDHAIAGEVTPVLDGTEFERQKDELHELVEGHACTHP